MRSAWLPEVHPLPEACRKILLIWCIRRADGVFDEDFAEFLTSLITAAEDRSVRWGKQWLTADSRLAVPRTPDTAVML